MISDKNELLIVCDRKHSSKIDYIIDDINRNDKNTKMLFFSLEREKEELLNYYSLNISVDNLVIVDIPMTIEKIGEYIRNYKPDIVYIDYIQLVGGAMHISNFNMQQQFILKELSGYANKFHIKIIATYLLNLQTSNKDVIEALSDYKVLVL